MQLHDGGEVLWRCSSIIHLTDEMFRRPSIAHSSRISKNPVDYNLAAEFATIGESPNCSDGLTECFSESSLLSPSSRWGPFFSAHQLCICILQGLTSVSGGTDYATMFSPIASRPVRWTIWTDLRPNLFMASERIAPAPSVPPQNASTSIIWIPSSLMVPKCDNRTESLFAL